MNSILEISKVYSGEEFNNLTKGKTFIKILNKKQNHNGFQYKLGLNVDSKPFNPIGTCLSGGLYFSEAKNFLLFYHCGESMWRIIIPNDSKVYVEENKFKADKFVLDEKCFIEDFSFLNDQISWGNKGLLFSFYNNQTPKMCIESVKQNSCALEFVKEQSPEICMEAVKQFGHALKYVREQTTEICMEAVKQNYHVLEYVKEQTPEICMEAVKQNGYALRYVREQTFVICMEAVKQNGLTLEYVNVQTQEICMEAVKQNGLALDFVRK